MHVPVHSALCKCPDIGITKEVNMLSVVKGKNNSVHFVLTIDSGCSTHTFNCLNYVDDFQVMVEDDSTSMLLADKTRVHIRGRVVCGVLGPVFYVPEIRNCLLSVRQMDRQGCETRFKNSVCEIIRSYDKKLIYARRPSVRKDCTRCLRGSLRIR